MSAKTAGGVVYGTGRRTVTAPGLARLKLTPTAADGMTIHNDLPFELRR